MSEGAGRLPEGSGPPPEWRPQARLRPPAPDSGCLGCLGRWAAGRAAPSGPEHRAPGVCLWSHWSSHTCTSPRLCPALPGRPPARQLALLRNLPPLPERGLPSADPASPLLKVAPGPAAQVPHPGTPQGGSSFPHSSSETRVPRELGASAAAFTGMPSMATSSDHVHQGSVSSLSQTSPLASGCGGLGFPAGWDGLHGPCSPERRAHGSGLSGHRAGRGQPRAQPSAWFLPEGCVPVRWQRACAHRASLQDLGVSWCPNWPRTGRPTCPQQQGLQDGGGAHCASPSS